MEDHVDEQEVDKELQSWIKEPPDVSEKRVCSLIPDLGDGEIPDEPAALNEGGEALGDGANRAPTRPADGQFRAVGGHEKARIPPVPPILPLIEPH